MKLLMKLAIPQVLVVICLSFVGYKVIHDSFIGVHDTYVKDIVNKTFGRVLKDVEASGDKAVSESSLFARLPVALTAFEMAAKGDMGDVNSPESQAAREYLRRELAPMLSSHEKLTGSKFRLHFHLPTGLSLARLWRDKQTRVNGEWVDISDDLRTFRPTVLDAYKEGKPMKGIEVGSGGFVVRGVVPVVNPAGKKLGTVEVLQEFQPILSAAEIEDRVSLILYINEELLPIATALYDPARNPRVEGFARVTEVVDAATERHITPELLKAGKQGTVFLKQDNLALAATPLTDYRNHQVGVLVCALNTNTLSALIRKADTTLMTTLSGMAIIPIIVLLFVLGLLVTNPLNAIRRKILDIAEDRSNLSEKLGNKQVDEIGDLARAFDLLTTKLVSIMDEMGAYVSMLHAVPDPIFAVDENYRMIMANKATMEMLGIDYQTMRSSYCYNQMRTAVCGTEHCPIDVVKRTGAKFEQQAIEICHNENCMTVKPFADVLRDSRGNNMGYVEVARVVAPYSYSQECTEQINSLIRVNEATCEIARQLVSTAGDQAAKGSEALERAVNAADKAQERTDALKNTMYQVVAQVDDVRPQLDIIYDLAEQTRLLAMDVAKAAEQGGDQGAFAGVADHVASMAAKTVAAAEKAKECVAFVHKGTQETTRLADNAGDDAEAARKLAVQSYESFRSIQELFSASSELVQGIFSAVGQHAGNGGNGENGGDRS